MANINTNFILVDMTHPILLCGAQWVQILTADQWPTLSLVYVASKDFHKHVQVLVILY